MENVDPSLQDQVPRGGPIYLPDHVGPVMKIPEFEALVVEEIQSLISELNDDAFQVYEDDILVDELTIFTEEELVAKALKEAFPVDEHMENQSETPEESANRVREDDSGSGKEVNISVPKDSLAACVVEESNGDNPTKLDSTKSNRRKKRGRAFDRNIRAVELGGSYVAKVEELAKIKQKQDEDKTAPRLHSFNGGCKVNEMLNPPFATGEKMKSLRFITSSKKIKTSNMQTHVPVSYPEIVLCVEIYHNIRSWVKNQEFLVLGRQTLTELRDRIYCVTDQLMQKAEQHDPSGYFLIEDVFCNDLRDSSAMDYSKPIFDWLKNSKDKALEKWECIISGELPQRQKALLGNGNTTGLPHFKTAEMHKVRFCDIGLRLGAGYLYCHQGGCKHLIVIRDMRLIHPEDIQNRAAYPVLMFQLKSRFNKCSVCKLFRATKVTVDDKWARENPCYFCDSCYYLLHYTKEGSLLYDDFTVYEYHH